MDSTDLMYVVESMRVSNIGEVIAIDRDSFSSPWSSSAYRHEILNNRLACFFVARPRPTSPEPIAAPDVISRIRQWALGDGPQEALVGYGGFWLLAGEGHISTIAVKPTHRQRGIGELLLLTMFDEAIARGATSMTLEVRFSNRIAQNLYGKYGFQPAGRRVNYYTREREDALIMTVEEVVSEDFQKRLNRLRAILREKLRLSPPLMCEPTAHQVQH
jgi:ribosomal-protein-alanine N-acetyltransferase